NNILVEIEKLNNDFKDKMKAARTQDDENAKMKEKIQKHLQTIQSNEKQLLKKENEIKKMQKQHWEEISKLCTDRETMEKSFVEKEKQTSVHYEQLMKELKEKNAELGQNDRKDIHQQNGRQRQEQKEEVQCANQFSCSSIVDSDLFRSAKLLKICHGHTSTVWSIDYSTFNDGQFLCSGSLDKTIRVWDIKTAKQLKIFHGHSDYVSCVKFSSYHHYNNHSLITCSASSDSTIRFWDFKTEKTFRTFIGHADTVSSIQFSPFNHGRYLCSGSFDETICLWDIETHKSLHFFKGHTNSVACVDFSPLQSSIDVNGNRNAGVGIIGGNGYTICSGSSDKTIRLWDVETTKELTVFKGHNDTVRSVKYSPYDGYSGNIICSGSWDKTVRLWDIRTNKQIKVLNGHTDYITCVDFSPFTTNSNNEKIGCSRVICSASFDNTIRFWDARMPKQLQIINENKHSRKILCLQFVSMKNKSNCSKYSNILCYGSSDGNSNGIAELFFFCESNDFVFLKYNSL
ncbi:G-protein beta WD-40 repeats containing protein, partial [Reticulomyxa filosa]